MPKCWEQDSYKLGATINRITPHVVWDAIEDADPYQVRAMVIFASNTLTARENAGRVYNLLKDKLEYFVAVDIFPTLTTELADIVLPAATWLENDNIADYWKVHGYVFPRNKAVEPEGEARPDHLILNELGLKLGFTEHFWDSYEESLDHILEPAGLTWDQFREMPYIQTEVKYRKYEKDGFNSASGKLDFYLHKYEEWGYDPLPGYVEPPESPEREPEFVEKYPLVLITGQRIFNFFGSEHRQGEYLRRTHPDPLVEMHPDTATARGIDEGDWVHIESPRGKVKFRARLFDGIDPRVVSAEWGWWFPEKDRTDIEVQLESNINMLTEDAGRVGPGYGSHKPERADVSG